MFELRVAGFEELDAGPDGDVLEGRVFRLKEPDKIAVQTAFGTIPNFVEGGVVVRCGREEYLVGKTNIHLARAHLSKTDCR